MRWQIENFRLQKQWEKVKLQYEPYLCDRISIVHKSGDALAEHYEQADMAAYCLAHDEYLDMAMPIKVFEAISYGAPLLATDIYSIGKMVREQNIGWVCDISVDGICRTLEYLKANPQEIREKTENTILAAEKNTWQCRAKQAAEILLKLNKGEN